MANPTPTIPTKFQDELSAYHLLAQLLKSGFGEDRPKHYISNLKMTVAVGSAAVTLPAGTTLVHLQVGAGDIHIDPANGTATTSDFLYKATQEYWLGPYDAALTAMAAIRDSADSDCYFEFYSQG